MSIRFTEDRQLRTPAVPSPIHTVAELRRQLRLAGAPVDPSVEAIRTWLAGHEPSRALVASIARSPYAAALVAVDTGPLT